MVVKRTFFLLMVVVQSLSGFAFQSDSLVLTTSTGNLYGELTVPDVKGKMPVVLFIAGSGNTDRDGNNPLMKNNALKFLGEALNQQGIATLRYDKRGAGASVKAVQKEADIRFDDFVHDAAALISNLKKDKRFSKVIVLGHSEGSTIGLSAAETAKADAMICVAGPGNSIDKTLKRQLRAQLPSGMADVTDLMLDTLARGDTLKFVPVMLFSLFRPSLQPFLSNFMQYDPQKLIGKLTIPVLIVQGKTDLQVKEEDALLLSKANPHAGLVLIDSMNHVLKKSPLEPKYNHAMYIDPTIPVMPELVKAIGEFIVQVNKKG